MCFEPVYHLPSLLYPSSFKLVLFLFLKSSLSLVCVDLCEAHPWLVSVPMPDHWRTESSPCITQLDIGLGLYLPSFIFGVKECIVIYSFECSKPLSPLPSGNISNPVCHKTEFWCDSVQLYRSRRCALSAKDVIIFWSRGFRQGQLLSPRINLTMYRCSFWMLLIIYRIHSFPNYQ